MTASKAAGEGGGQGEAKRDGHRGTGRSPSAHPSALPDEEGGVATGERSPGLIEVRQKADAEARERANRLIDEWMSREG